MSNVMGALRRKILTPNMSATRLDVRGFHQKNVSARTLLETIGATFLTGYGFAAQARSVTEARQHLETVPEQFRGFAYEGAAMGFAIRDGLPGPRGRRVASFMAGPAERHIYMAYVGVGWAMARLPRWCWPRLSAPDPLLRWLALDGYGFHQAYFHTRRYVHEQYRDPAVRWPPGGPRWYADRVIDQGVGRAAWFVGGADARQVARLLDRFPEPRRADLYAGAGLAATYAGGADEAELRWFWRHAGPYRPQVAQGAAFAAGARVRADLVTPHTELATGVFCGMSAADAWQVTEKALPDAADTGQQPAYEIWRRRIAERLLPSTG